VPIYRAHWYPFAHYKSQILLALLRTNYPSFCPSFFCRRKTDGSQRIEQIIERLDLTEDQQQQVRPILQSSMEQRRAVLDAHGVGPGKGKPDQQTQSAEHKSTGSSQYNV
jgi:Spy/CpxP family protein refolding chaperone